MTGQVSTEELKIMLEAMKDTVLGDEELFYWFDENGISLIEEVLKYREHKVEK